MTSPPPLLFVVGSGVQLDSVRRVVPHLRRSATVLDIWRSAAVPLDQLTVPGHVAPVSLARLRAVAAATIEWVHAHRRGIVVVPQDVGLVYRRVIAAARRAGARIAFLPDGAVSRGKVTARSPLGGLVPVADTILRRLGLVAGRHGEMAASRPDLVLSWGPGWDPIYRDHGITEVIDVGNPRADELARLPQPVTGKVLICSQPMDHAAIGGASAEAAWYEFLERMAETAPDNSLAIRLHPMEKDKLDRLPLGVAAKARLTQSVSLAEDIGSVGAVVSWASTTMIEAAGAHRAVVSVAVNEAAARMAQGFVIQRDPRAVCVLSAELPHFVSLEAVIARARARQVGMAEDYLVNVGTAAKAVAAALDDM